MSKLLQRCVLLIAAIFVAFPLHPTEHGFALPTQSGTPPVPPPVVEADLPEEQHEIIGDLGYEEYPPGNDHISNQKLKWTSSSLECQGICHVSRAYINILILIICIMFETNLTISNTTWMKQQFLQFLQLKGDFCLPMLRRMSFHQCHKFQIFLGGIDHILQFPKTALFNGFEGKVS